jgi:hypothetical protein
MGTIQKLQMHIRNPEKAVVSKVIHSQLGTTIEKEQES